VTDTDLFPFLDTFRGLTRVLFLRGDVHELQDVGKSYFKALRRFTLPQVQEAAEKCLSECKHFPKPVEWADRITRRIPVEIAELSATETAEYLEAGRLHYHGEPCPCTECCAAGVTHRFLRFVPECTEDGRDAHARIGERVVTRGHWAHGEELTRWYAARETFRAKFGVGSRAKTMEHRPKLSFQQRLGAIYAQKPKVDPEPSA